MGTWRENEDSLSVASESADKPLMVIYHDGKPVNAEVVTINEWIVDGPGMKMPDECCETAGCETICADCDTEECFDALRDRGREVIQSFITATTCVKAKRRK